LANVLASFRQHVLLFDDRHFERIRPLAAALLKA